MHFQRFPLFLGPFQLGLTLTLAYYMFETFTSLSYL